MMMRDTFVVTIEGQEAYTWQGTIAYLGKTYRFHSELELLLSIHRLLKGNVSQAQFDEEKENI